MTFIIYTYYSDIALLIILTLLDLYVRTLAKYNLIHHALSLRTSIILPIFVTLLSLTKPLETTKPAFSIPSLSYCCFAGSVPMLIRFTDSSLLEHGFLSLIDIPFIVILSLLVYL